MNYYIDVFMETFLFGLLAGAQIQTELYWWQVKAEYYTYGLQLPE
jgi:hypothetical protein